MQAVDFLGLRAIWGLGLLKQEVGFYRGLGFIGFHTISYQSSALGLHQSHGAMPHSDLGESRIYGC